MAVLQPAAPGGRSISSEERNYVLVRRLKSVSTHAILIVFGITFMLPFVWMISSSLKPNVDIFELPVRLIPKTYRPENYVDATNAIPFWQYLWNSTYYTIFATIGAVLSNTFIAYGFARVRWRGRNLMFIIVIATMMLPFQVRMIPLYILFAKLGWLNYLPAPDRPELFRQRLLHIPDAPVHDDACRASWTMPRGLMAPANGASSGG